MVKTFCTKKRHHVVVEGSTSNLLVNLSHLIPFNLEDFYLRTLVEAAQDPYELKPYAPWIMNFIVRHTQHDYVPDVI